MSKILGLAVALLTFLSAGTPVSADGYAEATFGREDHHDHDDDLAPPIVDSDGWATADPYGQATSPGLGIGLPHHLASCEILAREFEGYPSLREVLGLSPEPPSDKDATETRIGFNVTSEEAAHIDSAIALTSSFQPWEFFPDDDGNGLPQAIWEHSSGTLHLYTDVDVTGRLAELGSADFPIVVHHVDGGVDKLDLDELSQSISDALHDGHPVGSIDLTLDFTCGKILVRTSTADDRAIVDRVLDDLNFDRDDVVIASVSEDQGSYDATRNDHHHNDNDGGYTVRTENVNSGSGSGNCTNSIPFDRSGGGQWVVTAAHCLTGTGNDGNRNLDCGFRIRTGSVWLNPVNDINNCTQYAVGGNGAVDVALFAAYGSETGDAETLFHGGNHSLEQMDYYQYTHDSAAMYNLFCHSGRNWAGIVCGYVTNTAFSVCTSSGCVSNQILVSAPAYDGDSGGTVWEDGWNGNQYAGVLKGHRNQNSQFFFSHVEFIRDIMEDETGPVGLSTSV